MNISLFFDHFAPCLESLEISGIISVTKRVSITWGPLETQIHGPIPHLPNLNLWQRRAAVCISKLPTHLSNPSLTHQVIQIQAKLKNVT